ncbi:MAG: hypothetical protein KIS81_10900 [Maricaulaceae bacterium]|nr:hypothetical protein [Maricaulaceae bacterium]
MSEADSAGTVIFDVASREVVSRRAAAAFGGEAQPPRISFASAELMFTVMTAKRWEILRAMAGAGPMSIREAARRVKRDVKAVHGDVRALLNAGVLRKAEDGRVTFPFTAIRIDALVEAA